MKLPANQTSRENRAVQENKVYSLNQLPNRNSQVYFTYNFLWRSMKGNLYSINKLENMTSYWRQITSLCQSRYAYKLELMSTLFYVILLTVAWAVFKGFWGGLRAASPPPPLFFSGRKKAPVSKFEYGN